MSGSGDAMALLRRIPGFAGATVLLRLSDGPSNRSWAVEQGGRRFVFRVDKPQARELGLNRETEKQVCGIVAAGGMAPPVCYFDAAAGVSVRPFLPGRSWTPQDLRSKSSLERLAAVLRRLHGLPPPGGLFDPLGAARRYADRLGSADAWKQFELVRIAHHALPPAARVLCHNDLVFGNILESDGVMLIDWEYAGAGDAFFDLAVVVQHHELPDSLARHLLESYLGRAAGDSEWHHLELQKSFYARLLTLWERLQPRLF